MAETGQRWSEVGQRLEALAATLKTHFERSGSSAEGADALQRLRAGVEEAVESAGRAVKDDAVRSDVRQAGRAFLDAVSASLDHASTSLKETSDRLRGTDADGPR
jgi:hypothetical protein